MTIGMTRQSESESTFSGLASGYQSRRVKSWRNLIIVARLLGACMGEHLSKGQAQVI